MEFKAPKIFKETLWYHYDAEVYPKISAFVKLAGKLDIFNERNYETSFVSYFSQKGFRQFCE